MLTTRTKAPPLPWSHYQQSIFEWVESGSGHALVQAVAGSGKTTTLKEIVRSIPSKQKVAVLAFNAHMAADLEAKLPKRITVSTIHKMGMYVLTRYFGRPFSCNETKYHTLANQHLQSLSLDNKDQQRASRTFLKEIIHYLQITLTEPTESGILALISHFGIETPGNLADLMPLPEQILELGRDQATQRFNIGLDDLLWLPHVLNLQPKPKDWVLVDEAQDLSRAQLDLVLKLPSETGRMVFVGDPQQAIFGFAGSDDQSWSRIQEAIYPTHFPLSITYRCPQSHVRLAKRLVPQIEAKDDAPKGEVKVVPPQDIKHITQPGDLILCRFTAPLVGLCLKLVIHHGIPAKVRGRDVRSLLSSLVKEVSVHFPKSFISDLEEYVGSETERYEQEGRDAAIESLKDRADALRACFDVFGRTHTTIPAFCQQIEALFDDEAPLSQHVILATIHRAKGDEADRVFLLKSDAMPAIFLAEKDWQIQQERNLLYVALTRSKGSLYLVPMPDKASQMEQLLEDPDGGIQWEESCEQSPMEQTVGLGQLSPSISSDEPDPEEFQIEVDALQRECQSLLWRFVQIAQAWQADFPDQMQVVWPRIETELQSKSWGIPLRFWLGDAISEPQLKVETEPKARSPAPYRPHLRKGDLCRYVGPPGAMNVTCWGKPLKVISLSEDTATVQADKWIHPYDIPIHHLRRRT